MGLILKTLLKAKNELQAIGLLAVPVLRYWLLTLNWHQEEIQKMEMEQE